MLIRQKRQKKKKEGYHMKRLYLYTFLCVILCFLCMYNIGMSLNLDGWSDKIQILLSEKMEEPNRTIVLIDPPSSLPVWAMEYAAWHREQREQLTEENWDQFQYLVVRCIFLDLACGGGADRLASTPLKLRLAANYNRILFMIWDYPAPLEEFLVPPRNSAAGVDWTVPAWLRTKFDTIFTEDTAMHSRNVKEVFTDNINHTVIDTREAFPKSYVSVYNQIFHDEDLNLIYHDLWTYVLFQPAPPIQSLIDHQMKKLNLIPNQYNALHIRSQYIYDESGNDDVIRNATNCALFGLQPPNDSAATPSLRPLYVASDTIIAAITAVQHGSQYNPNIFFYNQSAPPLHLDRGKDLLSDRGRDNKALREQNRPDAFYSVFVDLYLLSQAQCIAYGRGGYGAWANLLSVDSKCAMSYFVPRRYVFPQECNPPPTITTPLG